MRPQFTFICLTLMIIVGCSTDSDSGSGGSVSDKGLSLGTTSESGMGTAGEPSSGNWPKWRGPQNNGISQETGWNQDWAVQTPTTLWERNVGIGFSSMAVTDGRLFTMGYREGQEVVCCLDARSGDEVWTHSYPGKLVDNMHEGGPCATPTVDHELVFTLGREGQLHCLRADNGDVTWSKALQAELGVKLPAWGFSCSPLVLGDILIVEAGRTVALNKNTGDKIWQTAKYAAGYGSPHVFKNGDDVLIAVLNNDYLLIVRAEDGREVAKEEWETQYDTSSTTPIVSDGHIFISTGYSKGCAKFRFDGKTLEFVYGNVHIRNHFNNCVLWDGHVYGIDGQSSSGRNCSIVCMDWKNGEVKWKQRGMGCGSILVADGKLLILADRGKLVLAEANPEKYTELGSTTPLTGKCWTVPVLAGGRIYCRNATGTLVCLDVTSASSRP